MSSLRHLKGLISLLCTAIIALASIDTYHLFSFLTLAEEGRKTVETNLAQERLASTSLNEKLTYVCISGCGIENGTYQVVYRLESKTPFLLTGEKGSIRYVYER